MGIKLNKESYTKMIKENMEEVEKYFPEHSLVKNHIQAILKESIKYHYPSDGNPQPDTGGGLHKHIVINWAFFPKEKPKYGDEIIVEYPPEQMAKKEILIYGRYTDLMDGCKWALITPCL